MKPSNNLQYWLRPTDSIFSDLRENVIGKKTKRRVFIDRGADVLFVAHVDTVLSPRLIRTGKRKVYAQGLDDRLGCMIAYSLSESLGADLLLTDQEESMNSTAQFHDCKKYNWIAEFDRAGSDVVTYDIDNHKFRCSLAEYWKIGEGLFSDICMLKTKACCVNIGIGYEKAHFKDSYYDIDTLRRQISLFRTFYAEHKDTAFVSDIPYQDNLRGGYGYDWQCQEYCDICGMERGERIHDYVVCEPCLLHMINKELQF